jgi:CubicO group peptidase (beta-lactamase class C family)
MRPNRIVTFSVWLVDRINRGSKGHALAGDLLEELENGRSMGWFLHQIAAAVLINSAAIASRCTTLLIFSAGWSLLYPTWRALCVGSPTYTLDHRGITAWPWATLLELAFGIIPAIVFVWLGAAVFAFLTRSTRLFSTQGLWSALSVSTTVLLAATLVVLRQLAHPQPVIRDVMRADFYLVDHLYFISVPLTLSLMLALLFLSAETPQIGRRRGTDSASRLRWVRRVYSLPVALSLCSSSAAAQSSTPPTGPTHGTDSELVETLKQKLQEETAAGKFSGDVLVAKNGSVIYDQAYGLADRERKIPNALDTRFRIGSINKVFTSVAILQLVQAGKINLEDPLIKYLPDYPNKQLAAKVTIGELISHTGGTGDIFGTGPNGPFSEEYKAHRLQLRTLQDYIDLYGNRPVQFEPGSRRQYSNYGYILLGVVIEKASGEDYFQYVRKHIYIPSGMKATGELPEDQPVPNRSVGYTTMIGGKTPHPNTDLLPYRGSPAGGGYSTAHDMFAFAKALHQDKLLNPHYTSLMMEMPRDANHEYGLQMHPLNGSTCVGHSGGYPGISTEVELCLDSKYIFVVLTNLDPPVAQTLGLFIGNWVTLSNSKPQ